MSDYLDPLITLDAAGIAIRHYYFPFATTKHIAWSEIRRVKRARMTAVSGRYRIWGSGNFRDFYNLDRRRTDKDTKFVLDLGRRCRPVLTPDDPDAFAAALADHIPDRTTAS